MGWLLGSLKEHGAREKTIAFQQCAGCSYDFLTGEGSRSCNWFECPYLPEALKVVCPDCNYNFATNEGGSGCTYPPSCNWSVIGRRNARTARKFFAAT